MGWWQRAYAACPQQRPGPPSSHRQGWSFCLSRRPRAGPQPPSQHSALLRPLCELGKGASSPRENFRKLYNVEQPYIHMLSNSHIGLPFKCLGCVWSIRLGAEQGQKMIDSWEKEGTQRDVRSCVPVCGPVYSYGVLGRSSPSLRGLESAPTVTVFI